MTMAILSARAAQAPASTRALFALCSLFVWSAACSVEHNPLGVCDGKSCPEQCIALKGPDCDVRGAACQKRIFGAVECVRGTQGTMPEIRLLTETELRIEEYGLDAGGSAPVHKSGELGDAAIPEPDAGAAFDAATEPLDAGTPTDAGSIDAGERDAEAPPPVPDAGRDPSVDAGKDVKEHWDIALELLGLRIAMPALDQIDDIGGLYDALTQRITLVDRGDPQDSPSAQMTLAHEFVHALQDQQYGLLEMRRGRVGTTDAQLASGCLTEGEARLYEQLSWGLLQGLPVDRAYWKVLFARYAKYSRDAVAAGESPLDRVWLLRYGLGASYLADAWLAGGNAAVARVLESPPITSAHWMHGYAEAQTRSEPLSQSLDCNDASAPAEFERISSDTLGAFTLFAFLAHNLAVDGIHPTEVSWRRALAWRQDRVELFVGPGGETAVSWRLRFADASTAVEVANDLKRYGPLKLRVTPRAKEVHILARERADLRLEWPVTDAEHCSPSTR